MRKSSILILACLIAVSSATATAKTRRHSYPRRHYSTQNARAARAAAEKSAAEIKAGRERIAAQIKALTHFVYLFGGIEKGIELAAPASAGRDVSPVALELNDRNKAKVKASISSVRQGLEKLESDFRASAAYKNYYPFLMGVTSFGEAAENQAAANRFDDAGRSLLRAVDQLTDALAAMR